MAAGFDHLHLRRRCLLRMTAIVVAAAAADDANDSYQILDENGVAIDRNIMFNSCAKIAINLMFKLLHHKHYATKLHIFQIG